MIKNSTSHLNLKRNINKKTDFLELGRNVVFKDPELDVGLLGGPQHGQHHDSHQPLVQVTRCQREHVDNVIARR